jgi:hypothetical protein
MSKERHQGKGLGEETENTNAEPNDKIRTSPKNKAYDCMLRIPQN